MKKRQIKKWQAIAYNEAGERREAAIRKLDNLTDNEKRRYHVTWPPSVFFERG